MNELSLNELNQSSEGVGEIIGGFIGAGLAVAIGATLIRLLLSRLNWPKNEAARLLIACFFVPVIALGIHANGPVAAIKYFVVALIVFMAYALRTPKAKAVSQIKATPEVNKEPVLGASSSNNVTPKTKKESSGWLEDKLGIKTIENP